MKLTPTDYKFLIEAIQQKADGLIEELKEDIEEDIARACEEVLEFLKNQEAAEHLEKPAPKRRGRPPLKKAVQGAGK
jgi:hypothetical protein